MDSVLSHPSVRAAYEAGTYTDAHGCSWRRGMDGWFTDFDDGSVMLCRHDDFASMVRDENPE